MPDVGQADLLDAEQRAGHRVVAHVHARLAGLVLDDELEVGVLAGELPTPSIERLPQRAVVDLERVVPAVLAGPELDVVGAEVPHHSGCLGDQIVGEPAHAGIGVGERPTRENPGVDLRGDPDDAQPVALAAPRRPARW